DEVYKKAMDKIIRPTIKGMKAEGRRFVGVLYAGLMIKNNEPKLLEYNVRMGDPETQPILIRLKSDLVELMEAVCDGKLDQLKLEWDPRPSVCVVMASDGYPASYEKGFEISGLDEASEADNVVVFHAGTVIKNGRYVNNGGRVLGVTALGKDIKDAITRTYEAVGKISWKGVHFRNDIGQKALNRT
ncbi:phosphoribosylamine--glycine ligase, partial [bacterium]|nr:phosphoribosylamine--glycine ligase [bacterium]